MSTKRIPIGRPPRSHITPEAIALFKRGLEIKEAGLDEVWEDEGNGRRGRRAEYIELCGALRAALGQTKPWDLSVFDVDEDGNVFVCWGTDESQRIAERTAIRLRRELLEAINETA